MTRMLLILGSVVCAAAFATPALAAGGNVSDPAGDPVGGAPDLAGINVDESGGIVTFTISSAESALAATHRYEIRINSDNNTSTGDSGTEYVLALDGSKQNVTFWRWNGGSFLSEYATGLSATNTAPYRITVSLASLGGSRQMTMWARSLTIGVQGAYDNVPDAGPFAVDFGGAQTPNPPTQPAPPVQPSPPATPAPPTQPSPPSQPSQPGQPAPPGGLRPGPKPAPTPTAGTTVAGTDLKVIKSGGREFLTAMMNFRTTASTGAVPKMSATCKGTLGGRTLRLFAGKGKALVYCAAPITRADHGAIRITMKAKVAGKSFTKVFRGNLKPAN